MSDFSDATLGILVVWVALLIGYGVIWTAGHFLQLVMKLALWGVFTLAHALWELFV